MSQAGGICVLVRRRLIAARRPVNLVQLDHLEPEAGDPEHEPGEGGALGALERTVTLRLL